ECFVIAFEETGWVSLDHPVQRGDALLTVQQHQVGAVAGGTAAGRDPGVGGFPQQQTPHRLAQVHGPHQAAYLVADPHVAALDFRAQDRSGVDLVEESGQFRHALRLSVGGLVRGVQPWFRRVSRKGLGCPVQLMLSCSRALVHATNSRLRSRNRSRACAPASSDSGVRLRGAGSWSWLTPITARQRNSSPFMRCMVPTDTAPSAARPLARGTAGTPALSSSSTACSTERLARADTPISSGSTP